MLTIYKPDATWKYKLVISPCLICYLLPVVQNLTAMECGTTVNGIMVIWDK